MVNHIAFPLAETLSLIVYLFTETCSYGDLSVNLRTLGIKFIEKHVFITTNTCTSALGQYFDNAF